MILITNVNQNVFSKLVVYTWEIRDADSPGKIPIVYNNKGNIIKAIKNKIKLQIQIT